MKKTSTYGAGLYSNPLSQSQGAIENRYSMALAIGSRLLENARKVRFGSTSAYLKIHDGRIVDVTHTVTESKRGGENETDGCIPF